MCSSHASTFLFVVAFLLFFFFNPYLLMSNILSTFDLGNERVVRFFIRITKLSCMKTFVIDKMKTYGLNDINSIRHFKFTVHNLFRCELNSAVCCFQVKFWYVKTKEKKTNKLYAKRILNDYSKLENGDTNQPHK